MSNDFSRFSVRELATIYLTGNNQDAKLFAVRKYGAEKWRDAVSNEAYRLEREPLSPPAAATAGAAQAVSDSDRKRLLQESNSEAEEYSSRTEGRWM